MGNRATADVAIVGGVMGTSIAYHLTARGVNVVLLEEELGAGSTGQSAACIRHHYSNRITAGMAHHSRQVLENFEEITSYPAGFWKDRLSYPRLSRRWGCLSRESPCIARWG